MQHTEKERPLGRLCGQVDTNDLDVLDDVCERMAALGYVGVMGNELVELRPPGAEVAPEDLIFTDDDAQIVLMSQQSRDAHQRIYRKHNLSTMSCHFLQTLQPMGKPPQWIFSIHQRLLDAVASVGIRTITTHFGWMFGEGNVGLMGDAVDKLNRGEITRAEFVIEKVKRFGGREKFWQDSLVVYEHLCRQAAARGITVTIETVPGPFGMEDPVNIHPFIEELGADNLGICIDSGHCHAANVNVSAAVRTADTKMIETHFHDNYGPQRTWPLSDLHLPIGVGTINWLEVIRALQDIDYQGVITIEQKEFDLNWANWHQIINAVERLDT